MLSGAMMRTGHRASLLASAMLVGCFVDGGTHTAGAGETGTNATGGATTSGATTSGATTDLPTGTGGTGETEGDDETSGSGATPTEGCDPTCDSTAGPGERCDVFAQDCVQGQKCAPYSADGDDLYDDAKCVPATGMGAPGEPCKSEGASSGVDDCQAGAACWDPNAPDQAVCVALCQGSQAAPTCPDQPASHCTSVGAGVLKLCLPGCDPLIQDCAGEDLCVMPGEDFVCVYDASGASAGMAFDPCERFNGCDRGLLCLVSTLAAECDPKASGCCLPMCSLVEELVVPRRRPICTAVYAEGMAPPGQGRRRCVHPAAMTA